MSIPDGSTLQQAVSKLVRASMGSSVPESISNEELDRHVAELILQEAKRKEDQYEELGLRAYLPAKFPENAVPKTNKRFLSSVIKSTDEHNKTLLRAQALASAEAKARKEEEERQQCLARAREAAESHRRRHRKHHRDDKDGVSSRHRHHRHKRKERSWDDYDAPSSSKTRRRRNSRSPINGSSAGDHVSSSRTLNERSHRSRSRRRDQQDSVTRSRRKGAPRRSHRSQSHDSLAEKQDSYNKHLGESSDETEDSHWRRKRRTEKSRLLLRDSHSPGPLPEIEDTASIPDSNQSLPEWHGESKERERENTEFFPGKLPRSKFKPIDRPRSPTPPTTSEITSSHPHSFQSQSPPEPEYSSKMDRYFSDTYDPRLDSVPLNKKPTIPKEGLIPAEDFEGWDAMLEVIQLRRQDRVEKKRLEAIYDTKNSAKKKKKKGEKPLELAWETVEKKRQALNEREPGIMDIRYQRKGSVREWDMGKVDVDLL